MVLSKELFGWVGLVLCLVGYFPYLRLVLQRKVKPHIFSWFTWGLVCLIIFVAQWLNGGGWGAWSTGLTGFFCWLFAALSLGYGDWHITRSDWAAFIGALLTIPLWRLTHDPLGSVILLCVIDALACYPTFRKSWRRPAEESAYSFAVSILKYVLSVFALGELSLTTGLFPITSMILNTAIVMVILLRRRFLTHVPLAPTTGMG